MKKNKRKKLTIKSVDLKKLFPNERNNIKYLKYRDMAIEYIKQGYNNIRAIYKKYYPNAGEASLDVLPYVLLDNIRFKAALEEAWALIKVEDLDIVRDVLLCLQKEMHSAKNAADRINAASWLGKTKGQFIDTHKDIPLDKDDAQFSLNRLSKIKVSEDAPQG